MVIKIQRFVILDCALYGCEDNGDGHNDDPAGVGCHILVIARVDLIKNMKKLEIDPAVHEDEGGKDFSWQQFAEVEQPSQKLQGYISSYRTP